MLRTGCLLAPQRDFVATLRRSGLPYRRPPATALLGHYAGRTLTGKFITAFRTHTTATSDARCPPKAFTIGLYPWSLPDAGQADGPLLFPTELCARAAPRTPEGPAELTPDQGSTDIGLRRDMSGSAPSLYL